MSNEKKNATLGMHHGTATGRLRKMILFDLLKRHNENICVRCQKPILLIEELSIEHVKPWEGISADLFWDLNNIAFSHMICNQAAQRRATAQPLKRFIAPEGMAWCIKCRTNHSVESFSKDATRWNGLRNMCRDQMKIYKDEYHESRRQKQEWSSGTTAPS